MALRRWPRKSLLQLSALRHRGLKLFHASSFAPESESVQDSRADSLGAAPDPQAVARVDKAPPAVLQRRSYQDHTPPIVYLDTHSEITRLQSAGTYEPPVYRGGVEGQGLCSLGLTKGRGSLKYMIKVSTECM